MSHGRAYEGNADVRPNPGLHMLQTINGCSTRLDIYIASLDVHGYTYHEYKWAMCKATKMLSRRERRARSILVLDNSER